MYSYFEAASGARPRVSVALQSLLLAFVFLLPAAFAAPGLTIVSPVQSESYNATRVTINVTSNETVDFFVDGNLFDYYVKRNATSYVSSAFGQLGEHSFTIFANNSNGVSSASVSYNITQHNPVYITDPGFLTSPDTEYVLANNVTGTLLWSFDQSNISVDLNGFEVNNGPLGTSILAECDRSKVFNGTLVGKVLFDSTTGCLFRDLEIIVSGASSNAIAIETHDTRDLIFEDVTVRGDGVLSASDGTTDIEFRNSRFIDPNGPLEGSMLFAHANTLRDSVLLEEVDITDFQQTLDWTEVTLPEFTLRNVNLSVDPDQIGTIYGTGRIYTQHLALINTTDQDGVGVPVVVEVLSNTTTEDPAFDVAGNPTDSLLVATNDSGLAEVWVTEKVDLLTTESPLETTTIEFDPYYMRGTTRDDNTTVVLNITTNSTFPVSIGMDFPSGSLSQCTVAQMLDLNGDSNVNSHDMKVIVDYMVGKPVTIVGLKGCEAVVLSLD